MNRRSLLLGLAFTVVARCVVAADDPIRLPELNVAADVIAKMVPRQQVAEIAREASAYTTFRFDELTMAKAPTSQFPHPVKCLVRDEHGLVIDDITNERLTIRVDPNWKNGFLSSNQPAEYSRFFLRLRSQPPDGKVTIGFCQKLLRDYAAFSNHRLDVANEYYTAGHALAADLTWYTVPDQVAVVFRSKEMAMACAHAIGIPPTANVVRVSAGDVDRLAASRGSTWLVADVGQLVGVTPWTSLAPEPEFRDDATLFPVGWVSYRRDAVDAGDFRFVAVAMWFPR